MDVSISGHQHLSTHFCLTCPECSLGPVCALSLHLRRVGSFHQRIFVRSTTTPFWLYLRYGKHQMSSGGVLVCASQPSSLLLMRDLFSLCWNLVGGHIRPGHACGARTRLGEETCRSRAGSTFQLNAGLCGVVVAGHGGACASCYGFRHDAIRRSFGWRTLTLKSHHRACHISAHSHMHG